MYAERVRYFNSTMVRLKESQREEMYASTPFQFHYGTIKRHEMDGGQGLFAYFNSTMVRLKAYGKEKVG